MAGGNHTTIVGDLAEDPEVRFTASGTAVANVRVAVTQRIKGRRVARRRDQLPQGQL